MALEFNIFERPIGAPVATVMVDPEECAHEHTRLTQRQNGAGVTLYAPQCLGCGKVTAAWVGFEKAKERFTSYDEVYQFDEEVTQAFWSQSARKRESKRSQEQWHWWAWYDSYLLSVEWQERRKLVLERCKGFCEGCLRRKATQVHHLTYEHVGNELLYELVALCDDCHGKAHEERR
jgi:hypothetical protein